MAHKLLGDKATAYGAITAATSTNETDESSSSMSSLQVQSHTWSFVAGILYVIIIVCGVFSEAGLRGTLIDYNDADTTISRLQESPARLRWSLLLDLTMSVSDVALSILLGGILIVNRADKLLTIIAMMFRIVQQAVLATNLLHLFVASLLVDTTLPTAVVLSQAFEDASAESLAMLFLYLHKYGYAVALVFFAISMSLLGIIIWQSRVFPRWLGVAIALAGFGYLLDSVSYFLVNGYTGENAISSVYMLPAFVAEFGFAGWLLARKPMPAPL